MPDAFASFDHTAGERRAIGKLARLLAHEVVFVDAGAVCEITYRSEVFPQSDGEAIRSIHQETLLGVEPRHSRHAHSHGGDANAERGGSLQPVPFLIETCSS